MPLHYVQDEPRDFSASIRIMRSDIFNLFTQRFDNNFIALFNFIIVYDFLKYVSEYFHGFFSRTII